MSVIVTQEFPILIAEDDENDSLILQRALRMVGFSNPFHISNNGSDVIKYLQGQPPYNDRARYRFPRMLITDIKMPGMDGFELLLWLQQNPKCNVIPSLVLSGSQQIEDVKRAYQLGVNSYLVKPSTFDVLVDRLRLVLDYWAINEIPQLPSNC